MAYKAFELMSGSCLEQVEVICRHMTNMGSFDGNATINQTDLEKLISSTYYEMVTWLSQYGFSGTQTNENVVGFLEYYNAMGASARAELLLTPAGFSDAENSRFKFLWREYHDRLMEALAGDGLSALGAEGITDARGDGLTAGGISKSDKKIIQSDTDATGYSFTRTTHDNPTYNSQDIVDSRHNPELP